MATTKVAIGQVWRRRKDGKRVRIEQVKDVGYLVPFLDIRWTGVDYKASGQCFESSFLPRYELIEEPS